VTVGLALTSCAANESSAATGSSSSSSSSSGASLSGTLNGVGSSAQANAQDAWRQAFQGANGGVTINYDPQGSGAGRTAFMNGGAQFAGSDSALKDEELSGSFKLCKAGTKGIDLPVYVSPIAIVFKIDGVDSLDLDAPTLAKIFSGKITKWNDPAIAALNKDAKLPSANIDPVYRSDKSGTTNNFTDYLHQVAPSVWTEEANDVFPYKTGEGALKGSGVVSAVTNGKNTIGYVDKSAAKDLSIAKIKVGSDFVEPTEEGASKIAASSPIASGRADNDIVVQINRKTTDSAEYPLTLVSNLIVCQTYADAKVGSLVKAYAQYVASDAGQQAAAKAAGSAPLTGELTSKVTAAAASIK
jgi:phosphate transport system substrate-binding protein